MKLELPPLDSEPIVYFLLHSGVFVGCVSALFFLLGICMGASIWGRYKKQLIQARLEIDSQLEELAMLKRRLAEQSVRPTTAPLPPAVQPLAEPGPLPEAAPPLSAPAVPAAPVPEPAPAAPEATPSAPPTQATDASGPMGEIRALPALNLELPEIASLPPTSETKPPVLIGGLDLGDTAFPRRPIIRVKRRPPMPPPAIPLQDGGTPLKNGSDAEPATEPFSFLLGGAMPEPEPALPVSTLAAIVRGSAPSSPPAALESIPALSVEALEAPSGLLLEDESPPASAESPAAPTSHDLAGPAPSLVEPALPVPLQFDPALGLLFLQPPPDADDLTQIRGISSTLAARLAELGIYTFRQIAAWDDNQVREFSHRLAFKDRIDREQWVEQARALAEKKTHKPEKEHGTPEGADGPPTAKHR